MKTLKESILDSDFINTKFVPELKTKELIFLFEVLTRLNWRRCGDKMVHANIENDQYIIKRCIKKALERTGKRMTEKQALKCKKLFAVIPFRNRGLCIINPAKNGTYKRDITLINFWSNVCDIHTSEYDVADLASWLHLNFRDLNVDTIVDIPEEVNDIIDYIYKFSQ